MLKLCKYFLYLFVVALSAIGPAIGLYYILPAEINTDLQHRLHKILKVSILIIYTLILINTLKYVTYTLYKYYIIRKQYVWDTALRRWRRLAPDDIKIITEYAPTSIVLESPVARKSNSVFIGEIETLPEQKQLNINNHKINIMCPVNADIQRERELLLETLEVFLQNRYRGTVNIIIAIMSSDIKDITWLQCLEKIHTKYTEQGQQLFFWFTPGPHNKAEILINCCKDLKEKTLFKVNPITLEIDKTIICECPDYVSFYDVNSIPDCEALFKALHSFQHHNTDIVHGRAVIRSRKTWYQTVLGIEYDSRYIIEYHQNALLMSDGILNLSGSIWKWATFMDISLDPTMKLYGLDAYFRAISQGYKLHVSRSVISYESPPETFKDYVNHIYHHTAGLHQLNCRYLKIFRSSEHVTCCQYFMYVLMFIYREFFYYHISQHIIVLLLSMGYGIFFDDLLVLLYTGISIIIVIIQMFVIRLIDNIEGDKLYPKEYVKITYCEFFIYLCIYPVYEYFMGFILTVIAHLREI